MESTSTYQNRQPFTYDHRSPSIYQHRSPFTYQHRSPSTYNNRQPVDYNHRSPFTYTIQTPTITQTPMIFDAIDGDSTGPTSTPQGFSAPNWVTATHTQRPGSNLNSLSLICLLTIKKFINYTIFNLW